LKRWSLSFFEDSRPNKNKKNNKMSSDMTSVPDLKGYATCRSIAEKLPRTEKRRTVRVMLNTAPKLSTVYTKCPRVTFHTSIAAPVTRQLLSYCEPSLAAAVYNLEQITVIHSPHHVIVTLTV